MHMDPYWFNGGFPPMGFPGEYRLTKLLATGMACTSPSLHVIPRQPDGHARTRLTTSLHSCTGLTHVCWEHAVPCSATTRLDVALSTGLAPGSYDSHCIH